MKTLNFALTGIIIFFASSLFAQVTAIPDLDGYVTDSTKNYINIQSQVYDVINSATHDTTGGENEENYEAVAVRRWNWFWSNRLNATGNNKGGFGNAYKALLQQMNTPICNSPINNGSNWQLIGPMQQPDGWTIPSMGLVTAIAVHPTNSQIIYVGTNKSGAWKTSNGGLNWTCITDYLHLPGLGVGDLKFDPLNPNTIFMATGFATDYTEYGVGLLKSTDAGVTWNTTGLTYNPASDYTSVNRLLIIHTSTSPFIVYATAKNNIYKSIDGGNSFLLLSKATIPIVGKVRNWRDLDVKPTDNNTIYAASNSNDADVGAVIYMTTDAGANWTNITPDIRAIAVTGFNNDIVANGTGSNSILGTTYPNIGVDGLKSSLIDNTFKYNSSASLPACYMPTNNIIPANVNYQVQGYGTSLSLTNNAMSIANSSTTYTSPLPNSATLTLATPSSYKNLSVLYEAAVNVTPLTVDVLVTFTDLTTQPFLEKSCSDWQTTIGSSYTGMGRTTASGTVQCGTTANLFEFYLPLSSANYLKVVKSITFTIPTTLTTGTTPASVNYFHVLAIGGYTNNYRYATAVSAAQPNNLWTLCDNAFYKRDNAGIWSTLPNTLPPATPYPNIGYYKDELCVSNVDANIMYAGGVYTYKNINGGNSPWTSIHNNVHDDIRCLNLYYSSVGGTGDILYIGSDGGISRTTNGNNWTTINGNGLAITQFYGLCSDESDLNDISGGTQDNAYFTYKPSAFPISYWGKTSFGDGYDCVCDVNYATNKIMYGSNNGGSPALIKSGNGGETWPLSMPTIPLTTLTPPKQISTLIIPYATNPINAKLYAGFHDVFASPTPTIVFDNSTRVSDMTLTPPPNVMQNVPYCKAIRTIAVAPSNPNYIYMAYEHPTWGYDETSVSLNCSTGPFLCGGPCGLQLKIFRSTDAGINWTDIGQYQYPGSTDALRWAGVTSMTVDPNDPNRMWCTYNGIGDGSTGTPVNRVNYYHFDGTNHIWTDISAGLPVFPVHKIIYQKGSQDGLYVGTDVGVFYTNANKNFVWECFNDNLPTCVVTDLEINYCHQKIRIATFGRGIWESGLATAPIALPTTPVSQVWTSAELSSDLIIPSGVTLTINTNVNIAKGRKITVAPGGTLKIDGGHLYNGCNEMWDKINVDGPTATLTVLTNAIIEDAYIAAYTNNGGVIKIKNTILDQNQVHIHIENVTTTSYAGYLFACTLQNTTGLQKPFTPGTLSTTPIEIFNCNNIVLGNDAFSTQKNKLKDFTNYGIRIVSSSVTIINSDITLTTASSITRGIFASNQNTTPYELNIGTRAGLICTAYSKNHISNFYHGIYINKNFSVHIVDNDIEQIGLRGIYISQCLQTIEILKKMNTLGNYIHNSPAISYGIQLASNPSASSISIVGNTLDLNKDAVGIYLTEYTCTDNPNTIISGNIISNIRQGIWVVNDGLPAIVGNEITFTTIPSNGVQGYGINVQNCCIPDIESNIIKATGAPDHLGGINAELCQQPYICSNVTSYMEKGIICRGPMPGAKIKLNTMDHNSYGFALENSGAIGIQGALPSDVSDNQWISNGRDSYSATGSNTGGGPNFYVRSTGNYSINSTATVGTPPVTSFILSPFIAASCLDQSGWRPANQVMSAINLANTNDSILTDEQKWLLNNQLYNFIKGDSTVDTSSLVVIQDFKDDLETQPVGKFNEVDNSISLAFSDTLALTADSLKMDSAQATNTSIVTNKLIEFYKKIVNDIYLNTAARNNFVFTNDQITWLNTIAPLCPFEAGPAVYQARMLMTFVNDTLTFDDYICDSTAHFRIGKQPESNSFTFLNVYPNPARDILFVDYILSKETKGEFVLCDMAGKELIKNKLDENQNQITIHCDKLSVGIYLYKLLSNGTVVKTGKLIKN